MAPTGHEERMLVNGELIGSDSGRTFGNINPATEEVLGQVADSTDRIAALIQLATGQATDEKK